MVNMDDVSRLLNSGVESAAQMSIGQAVLRVVDKILWIVEKSIQWSLPAAEKSQEENGKTFGEVELVRPLPWIVFLPGLIFLRMIRIGLNTGAFVFGYPRIEPTDMIRFIERGRRRIRIIKNTGLKNIRQNRCTPTKDRAMNMKEASKSLAKTIRLTLSTLSCLDSGSKTSSSPPPTKIRVSNILDSVSSLSEGKEMNDVSHDSKRKHSELSSESESDEESVQVKLDRLAADSSDSGSDFSPNDCTVSESEPETDSEVDVSIPLSELNDLQKDSAVTEKILLNNSLAPESQCDKEQHKTNNDVKSPVSDQPLSPSAEEPPTMTTVSSTTDHEVYYATTNGVGSNELDTAYYSPISWKSVSPDLSISSDKQDSQFDTDGKSEELSNGEVTDEKEKDDSDTTKPHIIAAGEEVANGHVKEKQQTSSHTGGGNKHHQKNKRGNHGNRKKK